MQVAEINAYDANAGTLTVSNITVNKGASDAYSQQPHAVGSIVRISDNYQFWVDIQTAINSKLDYDSDMARSAQTFAGIKANSMTTTERNALTGAN